VLGVDDRPGGPLAVHVEQAGPRPLCLGCGTSPAVKDREMVELVDLPAFGRRTRLCWRKIRWACLVVECPMTTWTWADPRIAAPRQALTDRAGRWVTVQVGRYGRSVAEVADELGCAWHTVNDAVVSYGEALVDDAARIGTVTALGLDETLFCRVGPYRIQAWSTSIVDVAHGQLLDVVEGRTAAGPCRWLAARGAQWLATIEWGLWTCRDRIGRCSTPCCPTPSRSPTRFICAGWPTRNSTSAAVVSKTRSWATGAARSIRSTGPAAC
jgi:hypothetical protein